MRTSVTVLLALAGSTALCGSAGVNSAFAQVLCADASQSGGAPATAYGSAALACGAGAIAGDATSNGQVAVGYQAIASSDGAMALGSSAHASGLDAVALGANASANSDIAVAISGTASGRGATSIAGSQAYGQYAVAIGAASAGSATVQADDAVAMAYGATAGANAAIAIGYHANAQKLESIAIGSFAFAQSSRSVVIGPSASLGTQSDEATVIGARSQVGSGARRSVAIGSATVADNASGAVSIGSGAAVKASSGVAIGQGAVASGSNSVALGAGSRTMDPHLGATASFGGTAAGLPSASSGVVSIGDGGLTRQIQNVSAGVVSASSTDAVNGSQLYSVGSGVNKVGYSTAALFGGTVTYDPSVGALSGFSATVNGATYTDITSAIQAAGGGGSGQGGAPSIVQRATNPDTVVLTAAGGSALNPGQAQVLSNVAAGTAATDAVNVAQLRDAVDSLKQGWQPSRSDPPIGTGAGTNTLTLVGDGTGIPVRVTNVAAGRVDTDAVNYGQVRNLVAYDTNGAGQRTGTISLSGVNGAPVRITNLADGVADGDAVNVGQMKQVKAEGHAYTDAQVGALRDYTNSALTVLSGSIRSVRQEARSGIAAAMALATAPIPSAAGKLTYAVSGATFNGQTGIGGSVAYRLDTQLPIAVTFGLSNSGRNTGSRFGIIGEL
jgi:autotransporter adhesin